jgi:hypothetical protein
VPKDDPSARHSVRFQASQARETSDAQNEERSHQISENHENQGLCCDAYLCIQKLDQIFDEKLEVLEKIKLGHKHIPCHQQFLSSTAEMLKLLLHLAQRIDVQSMVFTLCIQQRI